MSPIAPRTINAVNIRRTQFTLHAIIIMSLIGNTTGDINASPSQSYSVFIQYSHQDNEAL
ncbi:hypothetical protein DLE02_04088 (plasmid) [Acinetobacter baumannii]|nr:hypothetical protein DLE02_04088 [Acinetobacter baumannii]